ncbi:hypothetical protein Acsp01_32910 [Actinoplanes sp. NBRC 101535]|nr:hypothetical protein Acsp01_32910 [Actinoplanes sp. NBRC 101535]
MSNKDHGTPGPRTKRSDAGRALDADHGDLSVASPTPATMPGEERAGYRSRTRRILGGMTQPTAERPLREVLAERGITVRPGGLARARQRIDAARAARDPQARAALRARLEAA